MKRVDQFCKQNIIYIRDAKWNSWKVHYRLNHTRQLGNISYLWFICLDRQCTVNSGCLTEIYLRTKPKFINGYGLATNCFLSAVSHSLSLVDKAKQIKKSNNEKKSKIYIYIKKKSPRRGVCIILICFGLHLCTQVIKITLKWGLFNLENIRC